jgi:hypothetical protein
MLFELRNGGSRWNYFFSDRAIHSLCKMLSTVAPCGSFADVPDVPVALWVRAEGKLLAAPYHGELASWLLPYMIRAKLRFDMTPSRRTLCGHP